MRSFIVGMALVLASTFALACGPSVLSPAFPLNALPVYHLPGEAIDGAGELECSGESSAAPWSDAERGTPEGYFTHQGQQFVVYNGADGRQHPSCPSTVDLACKVFGPDVTGGSQIVSRIACCANPHIAPRLQSSARR